MSHGQNDRKTGRMDALSMDLKSYGLNPKQWRVMSIELDSNIFVIKLRKDETVQLLGKTDIPSGKIRWKSLELISI